MKIPQLSYLRISKRNLWKSLAILLIGLVLTTIATEISVYEAKSDINKEFALQCNEIKSVVYVRLQAHAGFLRGGAALFASSDSVTRYDWKAFYEHSSINKNLPGIQGIGYAKIIPKGELEQHTQSVRSEGFPNYSIFPAGDRDVYSSILYLEPFEGRNLRAFGYDMLSEPVRRKAMELSCDFNLAMLSGKVRLVQETDENVQAGTLMYVPVYDNDMPITTVEQRRAAIKGWVYSPYRMTNLMRGILGVRDSISHQRIRLQVYDNDTLSNKGLLYDSQKNDTLAHKARFSCEKALPIDFNGKHWILKFTQSNPQNLFLQGEALTVMLSGFGISLLLFSLSFSLSNTRFRARQIADKLTADLQESEAKYRYDFVLLQAIVESPNSIIVFALDTNYCYISFTEYHKKTMKNIWGADIALGMNMLTAISNTEDKQSAKNNFDKAFQGEMFVVEEQYGDQSRLPLYYENHYNPIKNAEGNIIGVSVFVVDITERKQAEEKLIEKEASLRFAQKIAKMGSWDFDMQTQKTNWSENYFNFFGFDPSEVEPSFDLFISTIHPEDLNYFNDIVAKVYAEKKQISFELRVTAKDNIVKWIFNDVVPVIKDGVLVKLFGAFIDITERKQWEDALRESEEKFKYMFENSVNGNSITQLTGEITFNKSASEVLGYSTEELKNLRWADIMHPDDLEIFNNEKALLLSGEKEWIRFEKRFLNNSGAILWADMSSMLRKDENGKPLYFMSSFINITKRKHAEEKISMLAHAIRSISECVSITDVEDNILFVNRALLQTYNYEESELIGKHISIIRSPNNPSDIVHQILPSTLKGGWNGELLNQKKDGTEFLVSVSTSVIHNDIGNPIALIGIAHDITEDKQAQAELLAVSQRLSSIMESTGDIIAMLDPDYHYILFNTAFHQESKRIFGKDIQAGDSMHDVLSHLPNDLEDALKHWKRALDGEDFIVVQQFGDTHLERHWYELHFSPVRNADEKVIGAVHIVRNITERKQTEEDMLEKNEELSNYLRIIAHDLRSPLVGLQGYAMRYGKQTETLKTILANCQLDAADKEQIDKITFEDMPKSLNAILISVDKMDVLINGLSKISNTGRATLIIKQVNMNHLFNAIVSTHNFQIDEHAAQINIAELPDCYGDENQLNQLFSNLMGNALKYYDASRPLVITVEGKINRNKVVYSITDTGIGISPRNLEKIWNVFFRVNPTSPIAGEGIGLSFVKRIADKHKGRIWAESTEGKGSTFFVELQQHEFSE